MRNLKLGAALMLSGVVFFSTASATVASTRQTATIGDNVVLPPTLTSPEDGDRLQQPFLKLKGNTEAKFKVTVYVDGKQEKFRGRKYITADKSGIFQAFMEVKEGQKDDARIIEVYAANPETGKISQATTVTVVLDEDMLLTQYHGQVGYCDDEDNFVRAPDSKKMYLYRQSIVLSQVGAPTPLLPIMAGSVAVNNKGEFKANLHADQTYISLLGPRLRTVMITEGTIPFEYLFDFKTAESVTEKDLGLICIYE